MSKLKVTLNKDGVRQLLRSDEMMDVCQSYASAAVASLGDGYETSTHVGENRVNSEVAAVSFKARRENLKNNTILKAVRK